MAPRSWFGRNAGLRPRLVVIVGIAMLAPGALAVLQAISSYGSSMRIIEQNLAQAAQLAASEEVNVIAASREILTSLAAQPDVRAGTGLACRRALQRAIGGLEQYEGAMVVNADGVVTCASGPMPQVVKVDDRVWFRDIMAGDGFVVSDLIVSRWLGTWGIVTAVPLVDDQGLIQGSVALFIGLDWLAQRYQRGARTEDGAAFALLDSRGEIITRDASRRRRSRRCRATASFTNSCASSCRRDRRGRSARADMTASGGSTRSVHCSAAGSSSSAARRC